MERCKTNTIRTFLAIKLQAEVVRRLTAVQDRLAPILAQARATPQVAMHLTVLFLGELHEETVEELVPRFERDVASCQVFKLKFQGVCAFPTASRARVVWAGLATRPSVLMDLKSALDGSAQQYLNVDHRPYNPHVTLFRLRRAQGCPELAERLSELTTSSLGVSTVDRVDLIQSNLGFSIARYRTLSTFKLGIGS